MNSCEFNREEAGDDSSFQMYENSTNSEDAEGFGLYRTGTESVTVKPYVLTVQLGNATVNMEVDTGASRSTVSQYVYNTLLTDFPLENTDVTLHSYSGERVPILGKPSFIWEGLVKQNKARLGEYFQCDRTCREQAFCSQVGGFSS